MSIDGVNGSGWLEFVGTNEWMDEWIVLSVSSVC